MSSELQLITACTCRATDFVVPGPGTVTMTFTPDDSSSERQEFEIHRFDGPGVTLGM